MRCRLFRLVRFQTVLIAGLSIFVLAAGNARSEQVKVRSAAHDGYGRIVFNWPSPVPYKVTASDGRMVVSFGSAIEPVLGGVVRNLRKYLSSAAAGADGRSVIFTLKEDFDVRGFDMGAAVIVDIVDALQTEQKQEKQPEKEIGRASCRERV